MGNTFSYVMLIAWPILCLILFRKISLQKTILLSLLGGFLFLPVRTAIDFPLIPPLDKSSIPVISCIIGILFVLKRRFSVFKDYGKASWLVYILIFSPLITAYYNTEPLMISIESQLFIKGLTSHDGLSMFVINLLGVIPLFIGKQFFREQTDVVLILKIIIYAAILYSFLIVFELRMSPQLHKWVYGYFPHSFAQAIRDGGFRAVVFTGHGLLISFFLSVAVVAALTLRKLRIKLLNLPPKVVVVYLFILLILCKSLAAIIYGLMAIVVISYVKPRLQMKLALVICLFTLLYPNLSFFKVIPYETIVKYASLIDENRARSLDFRFTNEKLLLEHASEKFFFGWGSWGRNRVYDENAKDVSTTDGTWIITFGEFGWLGFIAQFGLITYSVLRARTALNILYKNNSSSSFYDAKLLSSFALLVSIISLDQLPNSSLSPWLWLLVGSLTGYSENIIRTKKENISNGK